MIIRQKKTPVLGWLLVFGSVAGMGASLALAQRGTDPEARDPAPRVPNQPDRSIEPVEGQNATRTRTPRQLGITFVAGDELVVGEIAQGSTAAEAGLRPRDRIVSIDGRPITGQRRFSAFLSSLSGRRVPVVVEREGRQYTIQLMPGDVNGQSAWLGVYLEEAEEQGRGARISQVYPGGPASRAGLRRGDVILRVNDEATTSPPDLIATVEALKPQTKVAVRFLRGDQELTTNATLASRDAFIYQTAYAPDRDFDRDDRDSFDDEFGDIPPHAMQLEHDRRMAEQHERIETELRKLQEEVRLLREALKRP